MVAPSSVTSFARVTRFRTHSMSRHGLEGGGVRRGVSVHWMSDKKASVGTFPLIASSLGHLTKRPPLMYLGTPGVPRVNLAYDWTFVSQLDRLARQGMTSPQETAISPAQRQ